MTNPEMAQRLEFRNPAELEPDPRNPKTHPAAQIESIAASIRTAGFCAPILVRGKTIVAGHGRRAASLSLGLERVPVIALDHLSDEQVAFLLAADNRLGDPALAPYDSELLASLLSEIDSGSLGLEGTGFDAFDLEAMLADLERPKPAAVSAATEDDVETIDGGRAAENWSTGKGQQWRAGDHAVFCGDCRDHLPELELVDCVVTDPPYGLGFMGRGWDHGVPGVEFWKAILERMKPGAPLLAFGGTRTFHRLATAIEDAGFEIRDCLSWLYGSGFPKGGDLGKAIDRKRYDAEQVYLVTGWLREARDAAGMTNKQIDEAFGFNGQAGHWTSSKSQPTVPTLEQVPKLLDLLGDPDVPAEIAELLVHLNGRKGQPGEAFKRRRVVGSRFAQDTTQATFACSIDAQGFAQTPMREIFDTVAASRASQRWEGWGSTLKPAWEPIILARRPMPGTLVRNVLENGTGALNLAGCKVGERMPANVLLDEAAAEVLDAQAGQRGARAPVLGTEPSPASAGAVTNERERVAGIFHGDSGGPSRFFYTSKASRSDRGAGNHHPTVKPTDLMRYLCRMVTPPGGLILDPFAGSGTTAKAAELEGFRSVSIELDASHVAIILERLQTLGLSPAIYETTK